MTPSSLTKPHSQLVSVFMIGNNPIDISNIYEKLKRSKKIKFITDAAFDMTDLLARVLRFHPQYILLDDNMGKSQVKSIIHKLVDDERTKDIPVTIVKNSNYSDVITEGVQDYILKDNVSEESVYRSLINYKKLRKTQIYLYKSYKKNKTKLLAFLHPK